MKGETRRFYIAEVKMKGHTGWWAVRDRDVQPQKFRTLAAARKAAKKELGEAPGSTRVVEYNLKLHR